MYESLRTRQKKIKHWVRVEDAVKVVKEHCVSRVELEKLLNKLENKTAPKPEEHVVFASGTYQEGFLDALVFVITELEGLLKK